MIRVAVATLGCKTNAFESSAIAGGFDPSRYEIVPFEAAADIYIVNTCTVTGRTDFKSRNLIRKALRRKADDPAVKVVVTGCYAQRSRDEVMGLGDIDLVVDNQSKVNLSKLLDAPDYHFLEIGEARDFNFVPVKRMLDHSRAFQKIQDGCDFHCAYCAVPSARGRSRSASLEDVVSQARLFVANGYKEIVLGGVNLCLYRDGKHGLADVVESLQAIEGLELIRLSSIEPQLLSSELLERVSRIPKLCPHFHIPLQSGCDAVLKRMGRRYDTALFKELISDIMILFPTAAIGLDVIAGFPGETDGEFENTLSLLAGLPITYLHAFTFSPRSGTPAASLSGQIASDVKNIRVNRLTALSKSKTSSYVELLIGKEITLRGVCEKVENGKGAFLSDHYVRAWGKGCSVPGELCRLIPHRPYLQGVEG
jgi:threonylcarbamoyladenosine tRNA methylthiotransferase MtaB